MLQKVGSYGGAGGEEERGDASLGQVAFVYLGRDFLDIGGAAKGHGGAAEASAGHAGAEDPAFEADLLGKGDHEVEFITGDLEVIAQGAMRAFHEGADVREVSVFEGFDCFDGAVDFGDDVAGAAEDAVAHFRLFSVDFIHRDVAPAGFPDEGQPVYGVLASGTVAAIGEVMADVRIGDDDGEGGVGEGNHFKFAGAAVDEDKLVFGTEGGGELVHDPAGDTGEIVFGFLGQEGLFGGGENGVDEALEESGEGAFEGGGGGEACSEWHG